MVFNWLSFRINLKSFHEFLINNIPDADGIIATYDSFTVVEKQPFSQDEINEVNTYYNSLTEDGELAKFAEIITPIINLPTYLTNSDAISGGLIVGQLYQSDGTIKVVF